MVARERVIAERRRRGWSQRRAAVAAGVANTHWANYERGDVGLDGTRQSMRTAVADAFGWELDWPESPPAHPVQPSSAAVRQVAEDAVLQVMKTMTDGRADIIAAIESLSRRHVMYANAAACAHVKLNRILEHLGLSTDVSLDEIEAAKTDATTHPTQPRKRRVH